MELEHRMGSATRSPWAGHLGNAQPLLKSTCHGTDGFQEAILGRPKNVLKARLAETCHGFLWKTVALPPDPRVHSPAHLVWTNTTEGARTVAAGWIVQWFRDLVAEPKFGSSIPHSCLPGEEAASIEASCSVPEWPQKKAKPLPSLLYLENPREGGHNSGLT